MRPSRGVYHAGALRKARLCDGGDEQCVPLSRTPQATHGRYTRHSDLKQNPSRRIIFPLRLPPSARHQVWATFSIKIKTPGTTRQMQE